MNLEKAIELLQQDLDDPGSVDISDLNKAQELGIEALKRWKERHDRCPNDINFLLPTETEK